MLCGAGLLLRTLISLQSVDPGSRVQNALTMTLNLPVPSGRVATQDQSQEAVHRFYDSVEREVAQTAGVRSVAIGGPLPLDGMWTGQGIDMEGDPPRQGPSRNFVSLPHGQSVVFRDTGHSDCEGQDFQPNRRRRCSSGVHRERTVRPALSGRPQPDWTSRQRPGNGIPDTPGSERDRRYCQADQDVAE